MMMEEMAMPFEKYWLEMGFQLPTPIQENVFKPLLEGNDVVGLSPTGTGKTLAYAIPLLQKTEANKELQLLVLVPSQELAHQVGHVLSEWGSLKDLSAQVIIGGANVSRQIDKLKEKPEIVVGTPGRLLELANQKKLKLHNIKTVIFDEADYLLQEEHLGALRDLIKKMPGSRQMGFFSATNSENLQDIQKWFNTEPLWFDTTKEGRFMDQTIHGYIEAPTRKRPEMLRRLGNLEGMQALVFVNATQELDYLAQKLQFEGINVRMLHSDYGKAQRKGAMDEFRKGNVTFLLTTDVSARGIDIQDLPYVIHYDLPLSKETYLHRSGRTGRMGKKGIVLSLVNDRNSRDIKRFAPHPDEVKEFFIYGGELVDQLPSREERAAIRDAQKPAAAKAAKIQKKAVLKEEEAVKESFTKKAKKKKVRSKDQKNKGARRKPKEEKPSE
ncbi:Superfamily II DNA and RNA helicase [Trichococcus ilyis]|uniref:Dead/deah box helicase n=2 Tax=Trichococcus ilyis TaxID=640938 RepID=A0A143YQ13_9LACT|nr:dead/deah box helicase [Trichococcus ilyis]SEJ08084.1 Superfamily II DNA and RNA helicase [Trichococcus ilyis]